jgi:hypothetical protein
MKQSIRHLSLGLALCVASFASQGLAQSTPQQVAGSGWQALTETAPAVTSDGTFEYIAWKGATSTRIYFSVFDGTNWTTQKAVGGTGWSAETSVTPALAWDLQTDEIWLAWKGATSNAIYFSMWNRTSWSAQEKVAGSGWTAQTELSPAFAGSDFNGTTLAWKGATSTKIWYTKWNYPGWATQQIVHGTTASGPWTAQTNLAPAIEATGLATLYWKNSASDYIWTSMQTPPTWTPQEVIACSDPQWVAETTMTPAAALFSNGVADIATDAVFWKDPSDTTIWYTYDDDENQVFCAQPATVSGSGWSAATNVSPAAGASPGYPSAPILAWKNATDNTIWFLDPTTLPGLSAYAATASNK